ncbi:MAG: GntR family transcriptional regulator [Gemmatimonadaceae bacterium]
MTLPIPDSARTTLPERTYERLRNLIVRGRIPSGARVIEAEVALRFGVSRTPVREAFSRLIHDRYLVPVTSGKRTELAVAPFTAEDVRELWEIIGSLESYAASMTAILPETRRIKVADELRRINLELRAAAAERPRNADKLSELQTGFHQGFVLETAGPHMRSIYGALRPQVQRYEWIYGTHAQADYAPSIAEHMTIIAAIREGNAEGARNAVIRHWHEAISRTSKVIRPAPFASPRVKPRRKSLKGKT